MGTWAHKSRNLLGVKSSNNKSYILSMRRDSSFEFNIMVAETLLSQK